jgi:hypothetical protein
LAVEVGKQPFYRARAQRVALLRRAADAQPRRPGGCAVPVSPSEPLCETRAMSQANPLRLFVTHAWQASDDYLRLFEYLESARNFFYRNYSTPDRPPAGDKEAVREDLRRQIAPVEAVIGLASLFATHEELLTFQLLFAQASHKPVVLLRPFGVRQDVPKPILDLANEVIDWDERALVDAIRRQARHEDTTRWDTIEFKLE